MSEPRKLPPEEALEAFQANAAAAEEIERIAAMSDAEVDAALAAEGLDAKAVRRAGEGIAVKLAAHAMTAEGAAGERGDGVATAQAQVEPRPEPGGEVVALRRRSFALWLIAAAVILLLIAGGAVVAGLFEPRAPSPTPGPELPPAPTETPGPTPENRAAAAALRAQAKEACDKREWRTCLERLDAAKGKDPQGDEAAEVQGLRERAERALPEKENAPGPGGR